MSDPGHVPGQVESEFPDEVTPEAPAPTPDAPAPEPEAPKPEEKKPEEETPEAKKPKEPEGDAPPQPEKKRSIYDAKQEEKARRKSAEAALVAEKEAREAAEAKAAELEALLNKKNDAETPAEEAAVDEEIEAFARDEGLTPDKLTRLIKIVSKHIPGAQLSQEDQQALSDFREAQAKQKQKEEDAAILDQGPSVRTQLEELGTKIHDEAEFKSVMAEIVRLAHTTKYHDKEIGYIVWDNRAALSKMISPKKASFEGGGQTVDTPATTDVDFSKGGLTPGQVQQGITGRNRPSSLEIKSNQ